MKLFSFAAFTAVMTFLLLLIGGVVNPMGASMACPDWYFVPTCNGELMPEMTGGVFFEHGHRLWASTVGLLTLALAISLWRSSLSRAIKMGGALALFLVIIQGIMGGVTVLLGLNYIISTLHLLTGIGFFCVLVLLTFFLSPLKTKALWTSVDLHSWYGAALFIAGVQVCLGGLVRHKGAILACGNDLIGCGESMWPVWPLGKLHMLHRFVAYVLFALLIKISISSLKKSQGAIRCWAWSPLFLVILQIALGISAIATLRSTAVVVMHTGIGALIVAILAIQYSISYKERNQLCTDPLFALAS